MVRLVFLVLLVALAGCTNRVIEANSRGISIEKYDFGEDPQIAANAYCAKQGRRAELYAIEPTTYVAAIYHYDCN